ncbi:hypothetical protein [Deinococcus sp. QL22]|uniref:hypothetical protein n=1 Tax=Deinococcus sp. QL22 TaxID=2939437 RepID=UPI002016D002|nr:hypothetical protein [Deinococcus sp. QL22]UQN05427.1 hypothetical protein M1R55_11135 [Deinococcus sp. QL22]
MNRITRFLLAFAVSLLGVAIAQSFDLPAGIPPEYTTLVTLGIGVVTGWLVYPLTAIAKKLGRTEGPTTVAISAGLSLAVALGLTLIQADASRGDAPLWPALFSAFLGWLQANGTYIARAQAISKGNALAPQSAPQATGEVHLPQVRQPSGVEALPNSETPPPGAQGLLGGGLLAVGLDRVLGQILTGLGLQGTPAQLARIGARLVLIAPDLLDGDTHLSAQNRNIILGVVMDLKLEGKLI